MPSINLRKPLYDAAIKNGEDPADLVNECVAEHLREEHNLDIKV